MILTILAVLLGACAGLVLAFLIAILEIDEYWRRRRYLEENDD
jgi:hypothetical protein